MSFQESYGRFQRKHWSEYDIIYMPAVVWLMHSSLSETGPSRFLSAHQKKKKNLSKQCLEENKVWNKKPAYSWHLPQSWYHTSVPVQGKYTLCFCKKCNKMSLWHMLGRAISKCWLKSVYLQRAIWSLNSTQSNLQWFLCWEAKPPKPKWGFAGAKKLLQKI